MDTLAQHWSRRIATRSALVVLLAMVPLLAAGLISAGGGSSLLPTGFGALTSGPSEQATEGTLDRPTVAGNPGLQAQALLALTQTSESIKRHGAHQTLLDNGTPTTTTPFVAPVPGDATGQPPPDNGGGSGGGGGGSGVGGGGGTKLPARGGGLKRVLQQVGSVLRSLVHK